MKAIPMHDREVIVLFDADRTTNPAVYDAGEDLRKQLSVVGGARQVRYASLPGHGSQGLDDVLAQVSRDERAAVLARVLEGASQDSGLRPSGGSRFFGKGGLQARSLAEDIMSGRPMALSPGEDLLFYRDGVYVADANSLAAEVASRLDEAFRSVHVATVRDFIIADLASRGRRVRVGSRLLNVANGMLDPLSGELLKHDPSYLSATQFPVGWDPHATAPVYEEWVRQCCGDQVEDLEETLSAMLDPSRSPTKAVLLYGPSRSGKSTLLRLARAVVGDRNASAVSLHQISTNKFMAAELDGKRLNAAADLSAGHIEDLSSFKLATGGDPIQAERKFGQPFVFTNRALFLFAANEIPSVGENSGAYLERMRPFRFGVSFAGREDPEIEERMLHELPGILASWVRALQRRRARRNWLQTCPEVAAEFARGSDKVRLYLQECTHFDERGTARRQVYTSYQQWCQSNGYASLGRNKFQARVRSAGVSERQDRALGWCFQVRIVDPDGPGAGTAGGQSPAVRSGDSCDNFPTTSTLAERGEFQSERQGERSSESVTTVTFDLETGDASALYTYQPYDAQGFVRLCAFNDTVTPATQALLDSIESAEEVVGHNVLNFDLLALARHHGLDYRSVAKKSRDTLVLARLADPPVSRGGQSYDLDSLARGHGLGGKSEALPLLEREYGGHDRIPLDHPDYLAYARRDVELTQALSAFYPMTLYGRREHTVLAIAGEMSLSGFRVDEDALAAKLTAGDGRRRELLAVLPITGSLSTRKGRDELATAFARFGVELPRGKAGQPLIGKESLQAAVSRQPPGCPSRSLAAAVIEAKAQHTVLAQVHMHLVDGRAHARVNAGQATGRWSITDPGLTVLGKRGDRLDERSVFLPEPGEVILTADLSQIDPRAVAAHCQDPAYLELFAPGRDFHAEVATRVLGDRSLRDVAKKLNNSVNYGVGANTLHETTGLPLQVCLDYLAGMKERFPQWAQWTRKVTDDARAGHLLDNGFGRKLRVDPDRASTAGPAAVGQSCARDILMDGLLRMDAAGLTPMLRGVVHDEVVLSVPRADYEEVGQLVLECLQGEWAPPGAGQAVPITAALGKQPGSTWAGAY